MTEQTDFDFLKELPASPKQKFARYGFYAGTAAIAVGGITMFMPSVINAGELLVNATWTAIDFGVAAVALGAGYVAVKNFAPVYERWIENLARRTAYGILKQDPITHLKLWLEEVGKDRQEVYQAAQQVAAIISSNLAKIQEYRKKADKAQQRYEVASTNPKFGPHSDEAQDSANEAEHFNSLTEELMEIHTPLEQLYAMLEETAKVVDATHKQAERDVEAAEVKWETALETEKGITAAFRGITGGSRRGADAQEAFAIIHKKYAGNFGKLRSLRSLTREVFSKHNLTDAVSLQKAVDRMSQESKLLLGHGAPAPQITFDKRQKTAVPTSGSISLFGHSND